MMDNKKLIELIVFILYFLISNFILNKIIPFLKKYFNDVPNIRSSHEVAKPSGGGVIFLLASIPTFLIYKFYIPLFCLPIAFIGLIDDKYNISSLLRFFIQFLTASIAVYYSPLFFNITSQFDNVLLNSLIYITLIISFTAIINFLNFMDGMDGLLAGNVFVILLLYSLFFKLPLIFILSSLLAFLRLNWEPAKLFMGDSGSTFLGSLIAFMIIYSENLNNSIIMFGINFPLLFDAFTCVLIRIYMRLDIFKAHKMHLYQRLNQAGWNHRLISSTYIFLTISIATSTIFVGLNGMFFSCLFTMLVGFILNKKYALPIKLVN